MKKTTKLISVFVFVIAMSLLNFGVAFSEQGGGGGDPQCLSGGPGTSECSYTYTYNGNTSTCSVTVSAAFHYACCYIGEDNLVRCIAKSTMNN